MRARKLFAVTIMCWALAPFASAGPKPAAPERECPHAYSEFDKIEAEMDKAASCTAARELLSACAAGGTSDLRLGGAALARCERDFLPRLSKAQKRAYQAAHDRCERRYSRRAGTIYRSAEAFCLVEAAEAYAKRFAKTPQAKK